MNKIQKAALALMAAGGLAGVMAESITFGVEIPPIASLSVRDGIVYSPTALGVTGAPADASAAIQVGGFNVQCNMPKWNIYFTLRNNGHLMSKAGKYLKDNAGNYLPLASALDAPAGGAAPGLIYLDFPADQINAEDETAVTPLNVIANAAENDVYINNATENTLALAFARAAAAACTGAAACIYANGWLLATDETNAVINLAASIDNTNAVAAVAGTYTETLYLTLVSAY